MALKVKANEKLIKIGKYAGTYGGFTTYLKAPPLS